MKLIVEMEMPCHIQYLAGLHGTPTCPIEKKMCKDANNPPKWCPIVGVLPEEHGDLIDRDALLLECTEWFDHSKSVDEEDILNAKAVIAAERSEYGTKAD